MRYFTLITGLIIALTGVTACTSPRGMVSADALEPLVMDVAARHDGYVNNDVSLTPGQQADFLDSTAILLRVVHEAQGKKQ